MNKKFLRVYLTIVLMLLAGGLTSLALDILNLPSDLGFYGGIALILAMIWITAIGIKRIWRKQ